MCEAITVLASILFSVLYFVQRSRGKASKSLATTALMFWGAALMWSVDGISNVLGGGNFLDLSREDAILGGIVVSAGFVIFCALTALEHTHKASV